MDYKTCAIQRNGISREEQQPATHSWQGGVYRAGGAPHLEVVVLNLVDVGQALSCKVVQAG